MEESSLATTSTRVDMVKPIYSKESNRTGSKGVIFNLQFEEIEKKQSIVVIPQSEEEDESETIPKWCKKKIHNDKKLWREAHQILKSMPKVIDPSLLKTGGKYDGNIK